MSRRAKDDTREPVFVVEKVKKNTVDNVLRDGVVQKHPNFVSSHQN